MSLFEAKNRPSQPIDLSGPGGNAFALMGNVSRYGKQLEWPKAKIDEVIAEMQSSDYLNVVRVFHRHFGSMVDIILPDGMTIEQVTADPAAPKKRSSAKRRS